MKGMNILCASQASTAICLSIDQVSATAGGQNPTTAAAKRFTKTLPCTAHPPPINPLPYHLLKNHDKWCSNNTVSVSANDFKKKKSSLKAMDIITRKSISSDIKDAAADAGNNKILSIKQDQHQVVVLKVSLHCKGCEGKVRKHLSKMKGVTSFNIDFEAKKVTIVGEVTPLQVLASVSKVKSAQFWTSDISAAPTTKN
ncbi:hypothetical protein E1A91_D01G254900v1 [Gossypium mustelinum]|uniref:HMA domain-containing protein n=3 Tax=Gossypium TaxID=3633 RepID=A0A5J5SSC2_GOSBA|nr:hypothetical protein ES319_D01G246800v1 [Gossypium barbadense]TYG84618.1 hypothetical protein ES288_D01G263600v1 [Gossypium darwinii]TYI98989.1 hypothetical protein E1A91_D01G254900v1 [Gossypium mustelinum]